MRDPALIQIDAAKRARDERDRPRKQALAKRRMALAEARLANIERLIRAYQLPQLTNGAPSE